MEKRSKPNRRPGEAHKQDNLGGGELDIAEGVRRRYKKNSSGTSKRMREGCDCGSEVWTVCSGRAWFGDVIFSKLECIGVERFLRFSRKRQDGSAPNVFQGLGETTYSLQPALKSTASDFELCVVGLEPFYFFFRSRSTSKWSWSRNWHKLVRLQRLLKFCK